MKAQERNLKNLSCWVVTEGMAGTENQCIAVAEALDVAFEIKRITLKQPWQALSPYLGFEQSWSFTPAITPPWPDLLIASGRKSIAAARYIKRASKGQTFTVQIQDPRVNPAQFDLVAVPAHDPTRGENVIVTTASPNRIAPVERLEATKTDFPDFAQMKGPRVAILIGGKSKDYRIHTGHAIQLLNQLLTLDVSLMITTSRRTPRMVEELIRKRFMGPDGLNHQSKGYTIFMHAGHRPNPYLSMLAYADTVLVTGDSASMLSDACSTGKPVYMIPMEARRKNKARRIDKLHHNLRELGALREFNGVLEDWEYTPLNDAQRIADEIRKRL